MAGATTIADGVIAYFWKPILLEISREPTRERLVELHRLISENVASVLSNLVGGCNGHLAPTITSENYAAQMGFVFVTPHHPRNYPATMVNAQDQVLGTEI